MQKSEVLSGSVASVSGLLILVAQRFFSDTEHHDLILAAIPVAITIFAKISMYLFRILGMPTYEDKVLAPKIDKHIEVLMTALGNQHLTEAEKSEFQQELIKAYKAKAEVYKN